MGAGSGLGKHGLASHAVAGPAEICVLHLVYRPYGFGPFQQFIDSYRKHRTGPNHDLALIFRGFDSRGADPYLAYAHGHLTRSFLLPERGFDIDAYVEVARDLDYSAYCFLNSWSVIQHDCWLAYLASGLAKPNAGIVGATGSWGSHRSMNMYLSGLPSPYAHVYSGRKETAKGFREWGGGKEPAPYPGELVHQLARLRQTARYIALFPGFPAPHVRTNAFAIRRDILSAIRPGRIRRKLDAHRAESGRANLTSQVERLGLRALVVGRDGRAYDKDSWHLSDTFWQANQENLLVADNQTREYDRGPAGWRSLLARFAWGTQARPGAEAEAARVQA